MEKPFYISCNQCRKKVAVKPEYCVVYFYQKQPWFSWLHLACPHCDRTSGKFFGPDEYDKELDWYARHDFGFIADDFAPDSVRLEYEQVYAERLEVLASNELTPRQEAYVQFFSYLLERGEYEI